VDAAAKQVGEHHVSLRTAGWRLFGAAMALLGSLSPLGRAARLPSTPGQSESSSAAPISVHPGQGKASGAALRGLRSAPAWSIANRLWGRDRSRNTGGRTSPQRPPAVGRTGLHRTARAAAVLLPRDIARIIPHAPTIILPRARARTDDRRRTTTLRSVRPHRQRAVVDDDLAGARVPRHVRDAPLRVVRAVVQLAAARRRSARSPVGSQAGAGRTCR